MFIITAFKRHKTPGYRLHSFTALLTAVHVRVKDFEQFGVRSACSCHAYARHHTDARFGVFSSDLWSLYCPGNFATRRRMYLAFQKPVLRLGMKTCRRSGKFGARAGWPGAFHALAELPRRSFSGIFGERFSLKRPVDGPRSGACFHDYGTRVSNMKATFRGFLTDETEASRSRKLPRLDNTRFARIDPAACETNYSNFVSHRDRSSNWLLSAAREHRIVSLEELPRVGMFLGYKITWLLGQSNPPVQCYLVVELTFQIIYTSSLLNMHVITGCLSFFHDKPI